MSHLAVKWLHLSCAALDIAGFAARWPGSSPEVLK
jgi:hypothetical protein